MRFSYKKEIVKEEDSTEMEGGPKFFEGKPEWAVLPWRELEEVVRVFEEGAAPEKYGAPFTYRKGIMFSKLFSAAIRHLLAWWRGRDCDQKTENSHLAHACANCLMLMSMSRKTEFDNRDKDVE